MQWCNILLKLVNQLVQFPSKLSGKSQDGVVTNSALLHSHSCPPNDRERN